MEQNPILLLSILIPLLVCGASAKCEEAGPILIESKETMHQLGISFASKYRHQCYGYGDGGYALSLRSDLLHIYEAQGFTKFTACLALVSGIRFDPESGNRLTTYIYFFSDYILRDGKLVSRKTGQPVILNQQDDNLANYGITDELPLSIPNCFKRGLPYSDCKWNFHPITGKKVNASVAAQARQLGHRIEEFLKDRPRQEQCRVTINRMHVRGDWNCVFGSEFDLQDASKSSSEYISIKSAATFYVYSKSLPRGYGYALYAFGGAGPAISPAVLQSALSGKKPQAQINPQSIFKKQ